MHKTDEEPAVILGIDMSCDKNRQGRQGTVETGQCGRESNVRQVEREGKLLADRTVQLKPDG